MGMRSVVRSFGTVFDIVFDHRVGWRSKGQLKVTCLEPGQGRERVAMQNPVAMSTAILDDFYLLLVM